MGKKLYIKTTSDKYELPVAVADSVGELAKMLGVKPKTILCSIARKQCHYYRVTVDEDTEE